MTAMAEGGTPARDLAGLLDDLADRVPGFRRAVLLARDGRPIAASSDLSGDETRHLAAMTSAVLSLANGTGSRFSAGGVRQTLVQLDQGFFFVIAVGDGSFLAALCPAAADTASVAFEMAMLAKRARPHLAALPRFPAADPA